MVILGKWMWKMLSKIKGFLTNTRCRICRGYTEPSIFFGNICSVYCLERESVSLSGGKNNE